MKTGQLTLVASVTLLAACGEPQEAPPEEPQEGSPAAYVMGPGTYAIGSDETAYVTTEVKSDGTYADKDAEGTVVGQGTWRDERGKACFDPEGDGPEEQERCWINSELQEDGSFVTTMDDGSMSYTVRPLPE